MYAQLGDIQFEGLLGFDALEHRTSANYAEHSLIDGKPRLHRVGTNLDEVTITIKLHVGFCDPEVQISKLLKYISDGEVLPFITGSGTVIGNFVAVEMARKFNDTDKDGRIVSVDLDVSLKEFYDAALLERKEAEAKAAGFANAQNQPVQNLELKDPQSVTAEAAISINETASLAESVEADVNNAVNFPDQAISSVKAAGRSLDAMATRVSSAIEKINTTTGAIYFRTRDLETKLLDLQSDIASMQTLAGVSDVVGLSGSIDNMNASVASVRTSSSVLTAIVATRQ